NSRSERSAPGGTRTSDLRFRRSPALPRRAGPSLRPPRGADAGRFPTRPMPGGVREYRRGGSPAGLYTFRRRQGGTGASPVFLHTDPAGGSARDYPLAVARWGFPEFTRFASTRCRAGPLFAEGNRRSIQLSYG